MRTKVSAFRSFIFSFNIVGLTVNVQTVLKSNTANAAIVMEIIKPLISLVQTEMYLEKEKIKQQ